MLMSYLTCLPPGGVLASARFFASARHAYVIPRAQLSPSQELQCQLWPWADDELTQIRIRNKSDALHDFAAQGFLEALVYLRTVLLQDVSILQDTPELKDGCHWMHEAIAISNILHVFHSECCIQGIFCSAQFLKFKAEVIAEAENEKYAQWATIEIASPGESLLLTQMQRLGQNIRSPDILTSVTVVIHY
jgi:hypothetical protein